MASFKVLKMHFTSPLHIGKGLGDHYDSGGDILHSDTISGALASAFCQMAGGTDPALFMNSYRVSSAFPFTGDQYFLPKPPVKLQLEFIGGNSYTQGKRLKKIEFIDSLIFADLADGKSVTIAESQFSSDGRFLFSPGKNILPYFDEVMQRVVVPRTGGDATPFYFERRFFNKDCGLYFIYETDRVSEKNFISAISWLQHSGFGTDKTVGNGQFDAVFTEMEIPVVKNPGKIMSLSLWCPKKEELSGKMLSLSSYSLIQRSGFLAGTTSDRFRHLRKRSIYMFTEGSLFATDQLAGKIENLRPVWNDENLHPVYRDGRAIYLPVNL